MLQSLRTVAEYRLLASLGKGGMARVYLALSQKRFGFAKLVVLKILRDELDAEEGFVEMFVQEARLAARLNHPNVVQTYEVGEDAGRHYIAMEYLEGQPLSAVVSRLGAEALPLELTLRVLCDALEGLHYAHELQDYDGTPLGLLHRDVSPQNVFVTYTGQAKILDFGIAKTSSSSRTAHGIVKGKSGYMAPEQARCAELDRRCDLFAVGVMLWEALAKRRLVLRTDDDIVAISRRAAGSDPSILEVAPEAPPELAAICDKAMASRIEDRYATAAELRDALEAYLAKQPTFDARRIAAVLEEAFAEERTGMRRLIEAETKRVAEAGTGEDVRSDGIETRRPGPFEEVESAVTHPTATAQRAFTSSPSITAQSPRRHTSSGLVIGALLAAVVVLTARLLGAPAAAGAVAALGPSGAPLAAVPRAAEPSVVQAAAPAESGPSSVAPVSSATPPPAPRAGEPKKPARAHAAKLPSSSAARGGQSGLRPLDDANPWAPKR